MKDKPIVYLNADGSYMDEAQILADLPRRVTAPEDLALMKRGFVANPEADLTKKMADTGLNVGAYMRSVFGRWIRNSYAMWQPDNSHWTVGKPDADGVMRDPRHPDNASDRIIEAFVVVLQGKPE